MNWSFVDAALLRQRLPRRVIGGTLHLIRDHLWLVLLLGALLGVCWLIAARGLRGGRLAGWLLVPLLAAAALCCWLGPDRLFPKKPFEGPSIVVLSENHALTLLDLPGGLCAGVAALLAVWLITDRRRRAPTRRA